MIRFPKGRLDTLERGGDAGRGRGLRRGALERGGDHPAGPRGVRMGRTAYVGRVLGFFESFPFFQIGRRLQAFVGPVAQHAFAFLGDFSPLIRVLLIIIMVPDKQIQRQNTATT